MAGDCHAGLDLPPSRKSKAGVICWLFATFAFLVAAMLAGSGCQTQVPKFNNLNGVTNHSETIVLREGDVVKISFPGAPNLTGSHPIRRDGKIELDLVGTVMAAGKTPDQLKQDLVELYKGQIETKEIDVEVLSSTFPIFVTGAVLRPMKVMSDHPMTCLEAIMECGGPDYSKANLKSVTVLRQENGHLRSYTVDIRSILEGISDEQFYMKANDIIFVRERFTWF